MSDPQLLIARTLGISSSAFLSGFAFSASYYGLPSIALAPYPLRLRQWQVIYDHGKLVAPPLSAISALAWGFSAWVAKGNGTRDWEMFSVAGLATVSFLPWTVLVMKHTNTELMRQAKAGKEEVESTEAEREAEKYLRKWWWMNYVRFVLPMVGTWVGLYAALK